MLNLINKLTQTFGVSGNEDKIRGVIISEIKDHVDEIKKDAMGNLIAIKKGNKKKIMIAAHMDEIGIIVTHIDENGFIRFSMVGGVDTILSIGQKVEFENGTIGVVYYEGKIEDIKDVKLSQCFIDIGASSKQETEMVVNVGDTACFVGEMVAQNNKVISKALDNRIGCAVLIQTIKNAIQTENEIYYVFTVQEEVGARGAKTAVYDIKPDFAIAVDVTDTGDTPNDIFMDVRCGAGVAIKVKDRSVIAHPLVKNLLKEAAEKNNIPYQLEVLECGGTDAGTIHLEIGGVPSGAISIPTRYIHSRVETASISDMENAIKLLCEVIK